jgi:hypothetical protein
MDSLNIFLWNVQQKELSDTISHYILTNNTDVVVLLEDKMILSDRLAQINGLGTKYHICSSSDRHISIFTSFSSASFNIRRTKSNYISLVDFRFLTKQILFGAIHFPSNLFRGSEANDILYAGLLRQEIEATEAIVKHRNTLLVGDFNMGPFEKGMVRAEAFNAVMSRDIAASGPRKVSGAGTGQAMTYKYFYNPMWSFLGDLSNFKPGTYFYNNDTADNHHKWYMFDQVLIRPDLIPNFVPSSLRIIETDQRSGPLMTFRNAKRLNSSYSDHLPLVFTMDLKK